MIFPMFSIFSMFFLCFFVEETELYDEEAFEHETEEVQEGDAAEVCLGSTKSFSRRMPNSSQ